MQYLIEGFLIGGALIIAIGAQNAYVLRQGLQKSHVFAVVAICALSDMLLILVGVMGVGVLISGNTYILTGLAAAGAVFLATYGIMAAVRAWRATGYMDLSAAGAGTHGKATNQRLAAVIATTLALTYLNPHVYLDTVVIFGSLSAKLAWQDKLYFTLGGCVASIVWFAGLGYGARLLAGLFKRPQVWRVLDMLIAVIMLWLAGGLVFYLVRLYS